MNGHGNLDSRESQNLFENLSVLLRQISALKNMFLSSLPSGMLTTLEFHRINGAGRHLLLHLVCIQLSKRHILLRHHRNSTLVIQKVRGSTGIFPMRFWLACIALLMLLHHYQHQSEDRSKPEQPARNADTCLSRGAETACLVVLLARLSRRYIGAGTRMRCGRRVRCSSCSRCGFRRRRRRCPRRNPFNRRPRSARHGLESLRRRRSVTAIVAAAFPSLRVLVPLDPC
jgi:hypothetical protein